VAEKKAPAKKKAPARKKPPAKKEAPAKKKTPAKKKAPAAKTEPVGNAEPAGKTEPAKKKEPKKIAVTQVRSRIGSPEPHRRTLRALGFTRHQQTVVHNDTPAIRGMIRQLHYLLVVNEAKE
jgi:large subunit ribosomal protein L30